MAIQDKITRAEVLAGIKAKHPTCARPDGTPWCEQAVEQDIDDDFDVECKHLQRFVDGKFYCVAHTALAANPTEE